MATPHLTEDDLILHYYGESTPRQEQVAATHLGACSLCGGEYARLQHVLGAIDENTIGGIEPPPSFERTTWARLQPELQPQRRNWVSFLLSPAPLALAAVVLVLVVGAFLAGRTLSPAPGSPTTALSTGEQIREGILLVDLGEHLDRSQMALVELVSADEDAALDISGERSRAEQLVADSRLYRQTADETGDVAISELLDQIERVLTDVAASPQAGSSRHLADVRRRIESRDLLFKVRVLSSEIRERQRASSLRQAGPRS